MKKEKYIYIMVSATFTKVGKMVRFATKSTYSHASISFSANMDKLYSFGRFYHCMPFIGGLVSETLNRFTLKSAKRVNIKIFKIPVTEEQFYAAYNRVQEIAADDEYAYNLVSAATFCLKHGVERYKTYVCSEFVSHILRIARPDLASDKPDCKVQPDDFTVLLKDYEIYDGALASYDKFIDIENEEYFRKFSKITQFMQTCGFIYRRYLHFVTDASGEEMRRNKLE